MEEEANNGTAVDETQLRTRKRRRQLRSMLRKAGGFPSFVALISTAPDALDCEESEDEANNEPDAIAIDVDEYLGLNDTNDAQDFNHGDPCANVSRAATRQRWPTPAEEGFYEGRVPLSSPDDEKYLSSLQQLIRSNLEIFSATAVDAAGSQSGRRLPIVRGKVGIRCIHCSKVGLDHEAYLAAGGKNNPNNPHKPAEKTKLWPTASVSYPNNIAGLHSICSQKPQLHFENCPNTPPSIRSQFYRHTHENKTARGGGEGRAKSKEVPAALYYVVSAKRLGLVDVQGGIRFGRDLKLEPLPLDAVLASERQESEELKTITLPATVARASPKEEAVPYLVGSGAAVNDSAAEQVLAEALAEPENPTLYLGRATDKKIVSDYMFLVIRQVAVCHATPADFATRGKKTRKMRIGFAGFCCRHCQRVRDRVDGPELKRALPGGVSDYSCRSFSSNSDGLASAIANTFALHLAKCENAPLKLRKALSQYKRIHPRQMSEMPHGSQRRAFQVVWERQRKFDVSEEEMNDKIAAYQRGERNIVWPPLQQDNDHHNQCDYSTTVTTPATPSSVRGSSSASPSGRKSKSKSSSKQVGRDCGEFPVSKDPATERTLNESLSEWKPGEDNGGLIMPCDRDIVSDYIFLTVRQLKIAIPTTADLAKGKRGPSNPNPIAGMCCMHCDGKDPSEIAPSCRSFATAPDNYASGFNTSLYNHMQNCQFVKPHVRKALADLRKLHSQQIQSLQFGAQRKFFTNLYTRLRAVPLPDTLPRAPPTPVASSGTKPPRRRSSADSASGRRITRGSESADDAILASYGFFEAPCQSFFCLRCRMVPLPFRARGSLSFARPTIDFMTEHQEVCAEDGMNLWYCVESVKKLLKTNFDIKYLTEPLFKEVILECFGHNEELATIFTSEIVKVYQMSRHGGVTRSVENYIKAKSQGLWAKLPVTIDSSKVMQAYATFAASVEGLTPRISDNPALFTYLHLISPSLSLSGEEDEVVSDGEAEGGSEEEEAASDGEEDDEDDGNEEFDEELDEEEGDRKMEEEITGAPPLKKRKRGKELRRNIDGDIDEETKYAPRGETQETPPIASVEDGCNHGTDEGSLTDLDVRPSSERVPNASSTRPKRGKELRRNEAA